jgi:hypothetical protein
MTCQYCHLYTAIGKPCEVCGLQSPTSAPVAVSKRTKVSAPQTRAKTPNWDTASVKPRIRKGDGSLQGKPKTVIALLKPETPPRANGVDPLLAKLASVGMDTNGKIVSGLMTGQVVQTIGWEKNYLKVVEYLIAEGYNVAKHRNYIVCGSQSA